MLPSKHLMLVIVLVDSQTTAEEGRKNSGCKLLFSVVISVTISSSLFLSLSRNFPSFLLESLWSHLQSSCTSHNDLSLACADRMGRERGKHICCRGTTQPRCSGVVTMSHKGFNWFVLNIKNN